MREKSETAGATLGYAAAWPHRKTKRTDLLRWLADMIRAGEPLPTSVRLTWGKKYAAQHAPKDLRVMLRCPKCKKRQGYFAKGSVLGVCGDCGYRRRDDPKAKD